MESNLEAELGFYDFDQDRTEDKFEINQIWALYDLEGMPRFYVRINEVFTQNFKLQLTWLEPNPSDEDGIAWNENDLPIACGVFKDGESETFESCGIFSHMVSWEKGPSIGSCKIWPRKGDVWALFKDWDVRWSNDPEKHRKFEFEIVEVLSDYVEGRGVKVSYLVKLKGFTSLFQRLAIKGADSFQIPSKELLRFSHGIPSYRMTGKESKGIVEGFFKLDPALVPSRLEEFEPFKIFDRVKKEFEVPDFQDRKPFSMSTCKEKIPPIVSDKLGTPKKRGIDEKDRLEKESQGPIMLLEPQKRFQHVKKRRSIIKKTVSRHPTWIKNSFASTQHPGQQQALGAFWMACPFCGKKYQYPRSVVHTSVCCKICLKTFIAYETNVHLGINSSSLCNHSSFPHQKEVPSNDSQKPVPQSNVFNLPFNVGSQSSAAENDNADKGGEKKAIVGNDGEAGPGEHTTKSFKNAMPTRGSIRKAVVESSESCDTCHTDSEEDDMEAYNHTVEPNIGINGSRYLRRSARKKQQGITGWHYTDSEEDAMETDYHTTRQNVGINGWRYHQRSARKKKQVVESSESCDTSCTDSEEDTIGSYYHNVRQNVGITRLSCPRRSARKKKHVTYKESGSGDELVNSPSSKRSKREFRNNETSDPASDATGFGDKMEKPKIPSVSFEEGLPKQIENIMKARTDQRKDEKSGKSSKAEEKPEASLVVVSSHEIKSNEGMLMMYPEPEFHDFDQDRKESKFKIDQIWALYDDWDVMPRFYARITKVCSQKFRLKFTWLEPNPSDEDGIAWNENHLPIVCGMFKNGGSETCESCIMFSYQVSWEKGPSRGTYNIWPRKGDVWALFKGWDARWSTNPGKYRKFEYEIVEILSDYVEGSGVEVAYLVKLKGFTSLFQRMTLKGTDSFYILSKELLRFSHRIPSYRMTGKEREGIVVGYFELDPASVPSRLQEFEPSKIFDNLKEEAGFPDFQDRQSCFKSSCEEKFYTTVSGKPRTARKRLVKKDSLKKQSRRPRVYSWRTMKEIYATKSSVGDVPFEYEKGMDLVFCKGSPNGVPNNKRPSDANSSKQQADLKMSQKRSYDSSPAHATATYELPDSEFHDFESEKAIDKFQKGQFWALYSDEDSMPRYYAQIEKVGSTGFSVRARWLEACPVSEEEIRWCGEGLLFGCGLFELANSATYDTTKTFSHQVQAESISTMGRFQIYPRKGEVWAVYKNWKSGWYFDELARCEYEIVEVLQEAGPAFRVLVFEKVEGYSSVFKGVGITKEIQRNELLAFSHQIPAFHLTSEKGGKLSGYLELDSASVPVALLSKIEP